MQEFITYTYPLIDAHSISLYLEEAFDRVTFLSREESDTLCALLVASRALTELVASLPQDVRVQYRELCARELRAIRGAEAEFALGRRIEAHRYVDRNLSGAMSRLSSRDPVEDVQPPVPEKESSP